MPKRLDIVGERYGRLVVLEDLSLNGKGKSLWKCLCDCGSIVNILGGSLRSRRTKSCGCIASENLVKRNTTHGKSKIPEYAAWLAAKARTTNPNGVQAKDYIGRGIVMEESWLNDFESFLADMGPKPTAKHSLERLDVNGNYCKENCIWATAEVQAFNQRKRNSNTSGRTGVKWNKGKNRWEVLININKIPTYLGSYKDFELACLVRSEAELKYYGFTKE